MIFNDESKREIFDVLVNVCLYAGYPEDLHRRFPECREYRFIGSLGFGGKLWWNGGRLYVNCYPEDETPLRRAAIDTANEQLAAIQRKYGKETP